MAIAVMQEKTSRMHAVIAALIILLALGTIAHAWSGNGNRLHLRQRSLAQQHLDDSTPAIKVDNVESYRRNLQTDDVPMNVSIYLGLYYLNETIADMLDPQYEPLNDVAAHFCWAVSQQANGSQVQSALSGTGTTIKTQIANNSLGCSILETTQVIDSAGETLFGTGYFLVLQLQVQQLVYLSNGSFLSQTEVEQIVLLGFMRGTGGRMAFRSLLRENPSFSSIVNVEAFPVTPTATPSPQPSSTQSDRPSIVPSLSPPIRWPSKSPTVGSSLGATLAPTTDNKNITGSSSESVIYGSVLGSLGILLLLSLCLLCTWFPICSCSSSSAIDNLITNASSSSVQIFSMEDDASEGVVAAHLSGVSHSRSSPAPIQQNRGQSDGRIVDIGVASSFDEISVYTAETDSDATGTKLQGAHLSGAAAMHSAVATEPIANPGENIDVGDQAHSNLQIGNNEADLTENNGSAFVTAGACVSVAIHSSPSAANSKEFDPFLDDEAFPESAASSYVKFGAPTFSFDDDLDEIEPRSGTHLSEERSQPSASSSQTPRIHNTAAARRHDTLLHEEKHDNDDEESEQHSDDDPFAPWNTEVSSVDGATTTFSTMSDNSLLRSILKDAERLGQHTNASSTSPQGSWKALVNEKQMRDSLEFGESKTQSVSSFNIEFLPAEEHPSVERASYEHSRHVKAGASMVISALSNDRLDSEKLDVITSVHKLPKDVFTTSDRLFSEKKVDTSVGMGREYDHTSIIGEGRHSSLTNFVVRVEKSAPSESATSSPFVLGIRARKGLVEPSDDSSVTSQDTGNPWLFDTIEQTLGPRSLTADLESISGRSSRSGRSHSSRQLVLNVSESSSNRATIGESATSGESQAVVDDHYVPRILDCDLKRLDEDGNGNYQYPDPEQSSSITVSSTSASQPPPVPPIHLLPRTSHSRFKELIAPPGKLGVVLADHRDGKGAVVAEVRRQSALSGKLRRGDQIIEIDGRNVAKLTVRQITELMASRVSYTRRLIITSSMSLPPNVEEEETFEYD
ncbi:hypothetical protein MPSEU_001058700 [Mayamaea pseudoterrestris]|nr:hypothetical protein MPSEU_001058700 [Mayamaea pseudoterrestris]